MLEKNESLYMKHNKPEQDCPMDKWYSTLVCDVMGWAIARNKPSDIKWFKKKKITRITGTVRRIIGNDLQERKYDVAEFFFWSGK